MQVQVHSEFSVYCALVLIVSGVEAVLSSVVPAPYNVSVTCDSYGVVLDWEASGLSMESDFQLEVKPDYGKRVQLITKSRRMNISDWLQDAWINRYIVTVKAKNSAGESETAQSGIFSYNCFEYANIICYLEFPVVDLSPGDNQLTVRFINPLHLYRHAPALRNLTTRNLLRYHVASSHEETNNSDDTLTCFAKSDVCESSVRFHEEREEYCVTLSGKVGLVPVRERKSCYRGKLKLSPSVAVYLIPLSIFVAVIGVVVLLRLCLLMAIKKKSLAKFPEILEKKLINKHLISPLKIETEPVVENPRVEPDMATSLQDDSESSTMLEISANSSQRSDNSSSRSSGESAGNDSGSYDPEEQYSPETTTSLPSNYDCPHRIEMGLGDFVDSYGL